MEARTKTCRVCLRTLPADQFYKRHARCKACYVQVQVKWNQAHPEVVIRNVRTYGQRHPDRVRAIRRKSARRHPDRVKARKMLQWHVSHGNIIKPEACTKCGAMGPLQAHHHKGYAPENALDVQWLCVPDHLAVHGKKLRKAS